jgi:hypothetical protein
MSLVSYKRTNTIQVSCSKSLTDADPCEQHWRQSATTHDSEPLTFGTDNHNLPKNPPSSHAHVIVLALQVDYFQKGFLQKFCLYFSPTQTAW